MLTGSTGTPRARHDLQLRYRPVSTPYRVGVNRTGGMGIMKSNAFIGHLLQMGSFVFTHLYWSERHRRYQGRPRVQK